MGQEALYAGISIDRNSGIPIYLQITNALIREIQLGRLRPGTKMMGIKALASLLSINKNTIERVYAELELQQWLTRIARKGTFVSVELPDIQPRTWKTLKGQAHDEVAIPKKPPVRPVRGEKRPGKIQLIDDGFPDWRLLDHLSLGRAHRSVFRLPAYHSLLSYTNPYGDEMLREVLVKYLNDSRGIPCSSENLLVTRGSQMAIFLGIKTHLKKGQSAIVGKPNYFGANDTLKYIGANILTVPVDNEGLVVDEITRHCEKQKVQLVYITPHHHHPTTVTLSPARRMNLLELAETYGFVILEDDYDYDFHFENAPVLPLSSADALNNTIYTGSFSKSIAPSLRIGYLLASKKCIEEAVKIRRVIDHQGDPIMERVMAILIQQGEVERMLRRSRKVYKQRRDFFCETLKTQFADYVEFDPPEGGLAVWAKFNSTINLLDLAKNTTNHGLNLATAFHYGKTLNALRLGFASLSLLEINHSLGILKSVLLDQ